MHISPTEIQGVFLVKPDRIEDGRGFFMESYHYRKFAEAGLKDEFVQDNHSKSAQGTMRGLHAQLRHPQGKLVRVTEGEIFDVAVDARPDSPTFGKWVGKVLSADNFLMLYVPARFLHGFWVTSPTAQVEYKCSDYYDRSDEIGVRWDDRDLNIAWPQEKPLFLSEKDATLPSFREMTARFELYRSGPAALGY
jgi:dTDP-4-dehydrorhamnose 3,5-epimerase